MTVWVILKRHARFSPPGMWEIRPMCYDTKAGAIAAIRAQSTPSYEWQLMQMQVEEEV